MKNINITEEELDSLINEFEHNTSFKHTKIEKGDYDSISKELDAIEKENPFLDDAKTVVEDYQKEHPDTTSRKHRLKF